MIVAIYPGTFDPITFGHIDIINRACNIFQKIVVVVAENPDKKPLFSVKERIDMAEESLKDIKNIQVISHCGLLVNCLKQYDESVIIRGLRAMSDFEYEFQMAFTNRKLLVKTETVFLMPSAEFTYLSSTMVKQIARFNGEISSFVPENVRIKLIEKFSESK
jgi:pantetheine-phosphate adenylyltransferase